MEKTKPPELTVRVSVDNQSDNQDIQDSGSTQNAERIDVPPNADQGIRPQKIYQPFSFPVIVLLMPASILGVLARLGLVALMTYDGRSVFPLAYVQAVGCLIMGVGLRMKEPLGHFYGPLYTALTTGFCGSLTTFSGWQLDIFNAWINAGRYHRGGLRDFLDGVGISTITFSLSLASLAFGYSIASVLAHLIPKRPRPLPKYRYALSGFALLTYAATFFTYFFLPASVRHKATAALLFGFPGALTRYILSILLNQRSEVLPLGTLSANTLGTAFLATFHVLQSMNNPPSHNACSILQGLNDGFCGCLTTVSTFAAELREFPRRKAVRYAIVSWVLGQMMMVLIFGTSLWTGHVNKEITCTFE